MRSLFLEVEKLQATLRGSETVISYSNLRDMSMKNPGLPKNYPFNTQLPNNMVCWWYYFCWKGVFNRRSISICPSFPIYYNFRYRPEATSLSFGFETLRSYPGKKATNQLSRFRRRSSVTKLHKPRLLEIKNLPSGGALLCQATASLHLTPPSKPYICHDFLIQGEFILFAWGINTQKSQWHLLSKECERKRLQFNTSSSKSNIRTSPWRYPRPFLHRFPIHPLSKYQKSTSRTHHCPNTNLTMPLSWTTFCRRKNVTNCWLWQRSQLALIEAETSQKTTVGAQLWSMRVGNMKYLLLTTATVTGLFGTVTRLHRSSGIESCKLREWRSISQCCKARNMRQHAGNRSMEGEDGRSRGKGSMKGWGSWSMALDSSSEVCCVAPQDLEGTYN